MNHGDLMVFALQSCRPFGERVAAALGVPLGELEEQDFPDGEHKARPLAVVRDRDVFVIQSFYQDERQSINDKLCRLWFFVSALRGAAAGRVTVVAPYLCYARQSQQVRPRDSVISRSVAMLFEAAGVDQLAALEVHDIAAFQNAFRIPTDHLRTTRLFAEHFRPLLVDREVAVMSPDVGGIKRAELFRAALEQELGRPVTGAFIAKRRFDDIEHELTAVVGDVAGRTAVIIDDMISTGATLARAVQACREAGAAAIYAAAAHGLFVGTAHRLMSEPALTRIVVTDSVRPAAVDPQAFPEKLTVLSTAELFADAIRRLHAGESPAELVSG